MSFKEAILNKPKVKLFWNIVLSLSAAMCIFSAMGTRLTFPAHQWELTGLYWQHCSFSGFPSAPKYFHKYTLQLVIKQIQQTTKEPDNLKAKTQKISYHLVAGF